MTSNDRPGGERRKSFAVHFPEARKLAAALALTGALAASVAMYRQTTVVIHLAGDSTMAPKREDRRPETGWGERLQDHFAPAQARVVNHAMNGRSTRTFISEGRWQALVDSLRAGDYAFVQFGHNDGSKDKVDRYTPPADYRANLVRMVNDVRAKHAHPVLFTPVARRRFDSTGAVVDTHGEYPDVVRAIAREHSVPLVDMHAASRALLLRLGPDSSRALFLHLPKGFPNYPEGLDDNTHFSPLGARLVANLAAEGLARAVPPLSVLVRR